MIIYKYMANEYPYLAFTFKGRMNWRSDRQTIWGMKSARKNGLYRGRLIMPFEHLSRFQNDLID